jgi:hypothetical protein
MNSSLKWCWTEKEAHIAFFHPALEYTLHQIAELAPILLNQLDRYRVVRILASPCTYR